MARLPAPRLHRSAQGWDAPHARSSCLATLQCLYASTHAADTACPETPRRGPNNEYVWPIYEGYDIYTAPIGGGEPTLLIGGEGYDAEATLSPQGDKIVFTSTRDGDLDLYTCDIDGSNIKRITHKLGYDGGAFFSPDGEYLVWRASRPEIGAPVDEYVKLAQQGLGSTYRNGTLCWPC